MGNVIEKLKQKMQRDNINIKVWMIGEYNSRIIDKWQEDNPQKIIPAIGYIQNEVEQQNIMFSIWSDNNPKDQIIPLWNHYHSNVQAIIALVDCSKLLNNLKNQCNNCSDSNITTNNNNNNNSNCNNIDESNDTDYVRTKILNIIQQQNDNKIALVILASEFFGNKCTDEDILKYIGIENYKERVYFKVFRTNSFTPAALSQPFSWIVQQISTSIH